MEDSGRRGKMGAATEEDSDSLFGSDDEDEGKKQPAASSASAAANDTRGHQAPQDARPGHRSGAFITVTIPWVLLYAATAAAVAACVESFPMSGSSLSRVPSSDF